MKRFLTLFLSLSMALSLLYPVFAAEKPTSFHDVPPSKWSHSAIMEMVELGMFNGTTDPDANGVASFDPTGTMTQAQFLAVITRYLYSDELAAMKPGKYWYSNNFAVAAKYFPFITGLLDMKEETLNQGITREQMAYIVTLADQQQGQICNALVPYSALPDVGRINPNLRQYVREAYSRGLLAGVDAKGTFSPTATLTREQGAMVAYRLVDPSVRDYPDGCDPADFDNSPITIYAGQVSMRPARAGDTYVKADGTKVLLAIGPHGILGEGQGVAPDANLMGKSAQWTGSRFNFDVDVDGPWITSSGKTLQNQEYLINELTGEGHWMDDWHVLNDAYPRWDNGDGSYDGQIGSDPLKMYYWAASWSTWFNNYNGAWAKSSRSSYNSDTFWTYSA